MYNKHYEKIPKSKDLIHSWGSRWAPSAVQIVKPSETHFLNLGYIIKINLTGLKIKAKAMSFVKAPANWAISLLRDST